MSDMPSGSGGTLIGIEEFGSFDTWDIFELPGSEFGVFPGGEDDLGTVEAIAGGWVGVFVSGAHSGR
jgi:hypothetical protein